MPGFSPEFEIYRLAANEASASGDYAEAEKQWLAALELAESDEEPVQLTMVLENLAEVFWYQRKYALAAPILRRLLRLYAKQFGPNHFDVGIVANNMAMLYHTWGKYAEAEPFYRQALAIKGRILGGQHAEIARMTSNYRDLLARLKQNDPAGKIDAFPKSLETPNQPISAGYVRSAITAETGQR